MVYDTGDPIEGTLEAGRIGNAIECKVQYGVAVVGEIGNLTLESKTHAARDSLETALDDLGVGPDVEVALVFATDAEIRRLNHTYRGLDAPTDVLSFPFDADDNPPIEPTYLGDILISLARAQEGARNAGHGVERELHLLAVHGLLHLLGHEDETPAGAAEMRRLEILLGVRSDGPPEGALA